jgi:hypothetical protein
MNDTTEYTYREYTHTKMNDMIDIMHHQCDTFHAYGGSDNIEDFDLDKGIFSIDLVPYEEETKFLIEEIKDFINNERKLSNGGKTSDFYIKEITETKIFLSIKTNN